MIENIMKKDKEILKKINEKTEGKIILDIMEILTHVGDSLMVIIFSSMLILFGELSHINVLKMAGLEALIILMVSGILVRVAKRVVKRERPHNIQKFIDLLVVKVKDYSFPSGHSTGIFSIAFAILFNIPQFGLFFLFIAFVVAISRVIINVHYPSDVIAGFLLSLLCSVIIHFIFMDSIATALIK